MAEEAPKKKTDILSSAGSIIGGLTTIGGWLGIGEGRQDRRQVDQQRKLNEVNAKTAREQADYEQQLKLQMWKDTNYGAQLEEAKKAGVSKAAAIGGSGTGTQGASVSSPSGGSAADAAATSNARVAQQQAGMQLASQIALMKAQKDNLDADTADTLANIPKKGVETDLGSEAWRKAQRENEAADMAGGAGLEAENIRTVNERLKRDNEREWNDYEAWKAAGFKGMNNNDENTPVAKAYRAGMDEAVTKGKNAKLDGRIKDAQAAVEEFKANLAKQGISPDTPWYIKLVADLAEKVGVSPLKWMAKK